MSGSRPGLCGRLFVVATPIGNDEDISKRALDVIGSVDIVAAEDTRTARRLMSRNQIKKPVMSCHSYNQERRIPKILDYLGKGKDIALMTDAGTPGISDPGGKVVKAVADAGFRTVPVPGPCAAVAAISVSGLAGKGYVFIGFLPRSRKKRRQEIEVSASLNKPLVMYESPRRIRSLLEDIFHVLGEVQVMIARELTKTHEEIMRGRLPEVIAMLTEEPRGECVVVVETKSESISAADNPIAIPKDFSVDLEKMRQSGMSMSGVAKALAAKSGFSKSRAYKLLLEAGEQEKQGVETSGKRQKAHVSFVCRGHEKIRATHEKTMEFKAEEILTPRETCVLGVSASIGDLDFSILSDEIEVVLQVDSMTAVFRATRNPRFSSNKSIVFRRSRFNCRKTLGVEAEMTAAQVDRKMVALMREPSSVMKVTVRNRN
ncbi:MAG: 16S rRNA (cytidine(1402)-2'-O)-methyltransferase [Deltaproteobacteria bacterium]|nr:16S rRNA (cytidine(1402)-2'-O)-methyltransferase [Deltaproteobacteria bacterium]